MKIGEVLFRSPLRKTITSALTYSTPRNFIMNKVERELYKRYMERDKDLFPRKLQEDKYLMARNLMRALDRGLKEGRISKKVWKKFMNAFAEVYERGQGKIDEFEERYGYRPPAFLTISPTKLCNLKCKGCYANSLSTTKETMDYDVFSRVIGEQKEFWNSHFTVISGGEPLVYKSNGKTLFDILDEHRDTFFQMYTNGTLIDEEVAKKFAETGNITPAISIEGFEKQTDGRRGQGVHKKILRAFESLRKAGVFFGISITATRHNADIILSDELIDYYFNQKGALYAWIFQYMPIGRSFTLDLMVTPEQRKEMYLKTWKYIREDGLFIADFWNCGAVSSGCISAGKTGGYFYIDWNANVLPCVFNPYRVDNIAEVYANGGNLNDVLFSPFFKGIRNWIDEYALSGPADKMENIIVPCAIRDHFDMMYDLINETDALPADKAAEEAIQDEAYIEGLIRYGKDVKSITDPIWKNEYLAPERRNSRNNKC